MWKNVLHLPSWNISSYNVKRLLIWHWNWIRVKWIDFCLMSNKQELFSFCLREGELDKWILSSFALEKCNPWKEKQDLWAFFHLCVLFESNRNHEIFFYHCLFNVHFFSWQCVLTGVWYNKNLFSLCSYIFSYIHFFSLNFLLFLFKFSVAWIDHLNRKFQNII